MKRLSIFMIAALLSTVDAMPPGEVAFPGTKLHHISSTQTGRDYDLYISIPADVEDGSLLPVIYVLDGHAWFKNVVTTWAGLRADLFVPPCIIVGIAYGGEAPDFDSLRAMDLTPTESADAVGKPLPGSGQAGSFLSFLEQGVIPLVEQMYPADPTQRILVGGSFGGLFTLFAALEKPGLFSAHVAGTPAVWWDDEVLLGVEQRYAQNNTSLPTKLYLFIGELEWSGHQRKYRNFIRAVRSRNYEDFHLAQFTAPGAKHVSSLLAGIPWALKEIFRPPYVHVPRDVLASYVGVYDAEGNPGDIKISLRQGHLMFTDTAIESLPDRLVPRSQTAFDCERDSAQLEFIEQNGIPTLRLHFPGETFLLTRQD